jgi:hypothetical protein
MSATRQKLLEISYITDHDCGTYSIGEIDFGINGMLSDYLKEYGLDGRNDILLALSYLTHKVHTEYQKITLRYDAVTETVASK